jgi:hypothetical protein
MDRRFAGGARIAAVMDLLEPGMGDDESTVIEDQMPRESGEEPCHGVSDVGREESELFQRRLETVPRLHREAAEGLGQADVVIPGDAPCPPCFDERFHPQDHRRGRGAAVDEIADENERPPLRMWQGRIGRVAQSLHQGDQFDVAAMDVADDVKRGGHGVGALS